MWHFLLGSETGFLNYAVRSLGLPSLPSPLSQHGWALPSSLVESWRVAPLVAFLLLPSLTAIPRERWEDALLDGLSTIGTIRHVALAAIRPLLLAVAMLLIGGALATFDSVLTLTSGGPGTETVTPALYSHDKAFTFSNWPAGAASGWVIGGAVRVAGLVYVRLASRSVKTSSWRLQRRRRKWSEPCSSGAAVVVLLPLLWTALAAIERPSQQHLAAVLGGRADP